LGVRTAAAGQQINPNEIVLTSYGQEMLRQRPPNDFPGAWCLPLSLPRLTSSQPLKIVSTKDVIVILYEVMTLL
jgi:hypothetical protein